MHNFLLNVKQTRYNFVHNKDRHDVQLSIVKSLVNIHVINKSFEVDCLFLNFKFYIAIG